MSKQNFFEDISSLIENKVANCLNMKSELDKHLKSKIEAYLKELDLVTSEEFEVLKEMNAKIIEENQELKKEFAELKASLKSHGN